MKSGTKKLLSTFILSILISCVCSYFWRTQSMPYHLSIIVQSSSDYVAQLFIDAGEGYSKAMPESVGSNNSNIYKEYTFPLPTRKIYHLKLNPFLTTGSIILKEATIRGRNKINGQYEVLHKFDLHSFRSINESVLLNFHNTNLIVEAPTVSQSPMIEIPLDSPLNHWEIKDFLDREWWNKSVFLFLLITPLIALSLLNQKKSHKMNAISFRIGSEKVILKNGQSHCVETKRYYRDTEKEKIFDILNLINTGTKWKEAVEESFAETNPWLKSIVTSPKRCKFLEEMTLSKNLRVLDIGAGWGQTTIPLARTYKVCALEPTPERLDFIQAAAKQENVTKNLFFIGSDYMEVEFQTKFDLILSIGVLEWIGAFREDGEAEELQADFLAKTKADLRSDGKLVIGIENRLGLKYLLGANDDHIGIPDIACHTKDLAKEKYKHTTNNELRCLTYSLAEYEKMLKNAGYQELHFYAALPDYKLPDKIFPIEGIECKMNDFILSGGWIDEHDGTNGSALKNQNELKSLYLSLAEMRLAHYFAPSFFIEAS
jgi:2-polyprenyl-3-methyl-5-hydroxy-6-metoxy-1,4-benzoquinol methylase